MYYNDDDDREIYLSMIMSYDDATDTNRNDGFACCASNLEMEPEAGTGDGGDD